MKINKDEIKTMSKMITFTVVFFFAVSFALSIFCFIGGNFISSSVYLLSASLIVIANYNNYVLVILKIKEVQR